MATKIFIKRMYDDSYIQFIHFALVVDYLRKRRRRRSRIAFSKQLKEKVKVSTYGGQSDDYKS